MATARGASSRIDHGRSRQITAGHGRPRPRTTAPQPRRRRSPAVDDEGRGGRGRLRGGVLRDDVEGEEAGVGRGDEEGQVAKVAAEALAAAEGGEGVCGARPRARSRVMPPRCEDKSPARGSMDASVVHSNRKLSRTSEQAVFAV